MKTHSDVLFCPECGSPSVSASDLVPIAVCKACGWEGSSSKLVKTSFSQEHGGKEQMFIALSGDLRVLIAKHVAKPFANFLMKWGFMYGDGAIQTRQLGRYLSAASRAMLESVIEERSKMEKERVNGN